MATIYGTSGDDILFARTNDTIHAGNGNDVIIGTDAHFGTVHGGEGIDSFVLYYANTQADAGYTRWQYWANGSGAWFTSEDRTGTALDSVERIVFTNENDLKQFLQGTLLGHTDSGVYATDTAAGQAAGDAYRIYEAAFNRIADKAGLGFWVNKIDSGMNMVEVSARFIDSAEFRSMYGPNPSNSDFLWKVYSNVLDRAPDQAGFQWWLNQMNTNPEKTPAKVLADFANSAENVQHFADTTHGMVQYDLWMS
jgi:hypothetical protein